MADQEPFAEPRLVGERFSGGVMPVDALAELAEYRNLILEVARALWKRANPGRQRIPKGFEAQFALSLQAIRDGSAVNVLVRPEPKIRHLFPEGSDLFEQSRDLVADAVREAHSGPVPNAFPVEALPRFASFGRRLRDGESIQLNRPGRNDGPVYDRAVRQALLRNSGITYTDDVELIGKPFEINVQAGTFQLHHEGAVVSGPFERFEKVLHQAIEARGLVRASATAQFDANDRIIKLLALNDCDLAPAVSTELQDSLRAIGTLQAGWMDGQGLPVSAQLLTNLQAFLQKSQEAGLPKPRLYPTLEGGVQAEWTLPPWEVSARFSPAPSQTADLSAVRTTGQDFEESLTWGSASSAEYLAEWVGEFEFDDHGDAEEEGENG